MASKQTKATETKVETPAGPTPGMVKAKQAVEASGAALTALEGQQGDALVSAHRKFGDDVRTLAAETAKAKGETAVALNTWSAIRPLVFTGSIGSATLAGRSEASVQRSVKVSLWFPNGDAVKAWRDHRAMILTAVETAKGKLAKATTDTAKAKASADLATAKANADVPAYKSDGLVSMIAYGDAKHDPKGSRLVGRTGVITGTGSNRKGSAAVVDATERTGDVLSAVQVASGLAESEEDRTPEARAEADDRIVAPGVTVGMLRLMSEADLRTLSAVALDMAKAKAKAKTAKATVPPVLDTTAAQQAEQAQAPNPLAGVSADTLAALTALLSAAQGASA